MDGGVDEVALAVFVVIFAAVSALGFLAVRWRRARADTIQEWGLGGRRFGTVVTWFLLGGDIYTAYTFIAVPALVFAVGGAGFFALPNAIILYPLVFLLMPRLWAVSRRHGYVTPADFVKGRYGSSSLALATAFTGLLATMPYIALQLVGMQVVFGAMGITGDWPLIIAFVILALYTYRSGIRASALIAIVKDTLIYVVILAAVIYIPYRLGGFGEIFGAAKESLPEKEGALVPGTEAAKTAYATLALGSALGLLVYPHVITATLSAEDADTIRRNAMILPAYTLLLGLIALLGLMAIAADIQPSGPNTVVPDLFAAYFPSWFEGVAFAAIAIGALVPAAVMSIGAANLFTRNIYMAYIRRDADAAEESLVARIASLFVKAGALVFIIALPTSYAIELQLLGGVWMLQTLPAIALGLWTHWLHKWALLAGWLAGMVAGTWMANELDFKTSVYALDLFGWTINAYEGVIALLLNLIVAVVGTLVLSAFGVRRGVDETEPEHYDEVGRRSAERPLVVA